LGGVEPQFGLLAFAESGLGVDCDDELGAHRLAVELVGKLAEEAADLFGRVERHVGPAARCRAIR
jgi:hypothetical protein